MKGRVGSMRHKAEQEDLLNVTVQKYWAPILPPRPQIASWLTPCTPSPKVYSLEKLTQIGSELKNIRHITDKGLQSPFPDPIPRKLEAKHSPPSLETRRFMCREKMARLLDLHITTAKPTNWTISLSLSPLLTLSTLTHQKASQNPTVNY